jgi:hypothetical protein
VGCKKGLKTPIVDCIECLHLILLKQSIPLEVRTNTKVYFNGMYHNIYELFILVMKTKWIVFEDVLTLQDNFLLSSCCYCEYSWELVCQMDIYGTIP